MIILGLGSNLGDRLNNLRRAYQLLSCIPELTIHAVSPIYISDAMLPENAPTDWDLPYLNLALRCTSAETPTQLLKRLKQCEKAVAGIDRNTHWGPRLIDIDILAWDQLVLDTPNLTIPHKGLQQRPFALWPLADLAPLWIYPCAGADYGKTAAELVEPWGSRFTGAALYHTRQIYQRIDTPQIVGILNVTPDSFTDGGQFTNPDIAVQHALNLVMAGAQVLDIGAESTSPSAKAITPQEEWQRLYPVLSALKAATKNFLIPPKLSIDTRNAATAKLALAFGIDWINDVSGLDDPAMRDVIRQSATDCVVMHHIKLPESRQHVLKRSDDPVERVYHWAEQRLNDLVTDGISKERIIFDPGIGFGKMAEQSLIVLKNLSLFKSLGVRVLIGHSRKSFFSLMSGYPVEERDIETTAMTLQIANQPIDYLRVHHVEMCTRALKVAQAFKAI